MRWYVKKIAEDNNEIRIGYSYELNDTCDGVLVYNHATKDIKIVKLSKQASELATKRLFPHIYGLLLGGGLGEDKRMVAIG